MRHRVFNLPSIGKDNYPAKLTDNAFNEMAYEIDANLTAKPAPLNVGYYHK